VQFESYKEDADALGITCEYFAIVVRGDSLKDIIVASDESGALERTFLHPNVTNLRCVQCCSPPWQLLLKLSGRRRREQGSLAADSTVPSVQDRQLQQKRKEVVNAFGRARPGFNDPAKKPEWFDEVCYCC
jgi:hypothetical protein